MQLSWKLRHCSQNGQESLMRNSGNQFYLPQQANQISSTSLQTWFQIPSIQRWPDKFESKTQKHIKHHDPYKCSKAHGYEEFRPRTQLASNQPQAFQQSIVPLLEGKSPIDKQTKGNSPKVDPRAARTAWSVASRECSRQVSPSSLRRITISRWRPRNAAKCGISRRTGELKWHGCGPKSMILPGSNSFGYSIEIKSNIFGFKKWILKINVARETLITCQASIQRSPTRFTRWIGSSSPIRRNR